MKTCGPCTLCCTVLEIPALAKPAGLPCVHAQPGRGCGIYPDRPTPCRTFTCGWLALEALPDDWRPDIAGFLVRDERDEGHLCIDVNPARPGAWQSPAYLPQIRLWSRMVHAQTGCVLIYDGGATLVVFPEGILDLGALPPQPRLMIGYIRLGGRQMPLVRHLEGETVLREWIGQSPRL